MLLPEAFLEGNSTPPPGEGEGSGSSLIDISKNLIIIGLIPIPHVVKLRSQARGAPNPDIECYADRILYVEDGNRQRRASCGFAYLSDPPPTTQGTWSTAVSLC